jgi:GTPase SAR1 family protein
VVIVYSITDKTSFASVRGWLETAKQHTKDLSRILLVGNKADLSDTQREVSRDEAQEFANEHRLHWIETSAKTDSNVQVVREL